MPTLLARNATMLVTMDDGRRELSNAGLFARDGIIEQVGPTDQLPSSADRVLDLNQKANPGFRDNEILLQAYYQLHVFGDIYVQPTVTYIPKPGASGSFSPATAISAQVIILS